MSLGLLGAYQSGSDDTDTDSETEPLQRAVPKQEVKQEEPVEALDNPFGTGKVGAIIPKPSFMQEQQGTISGLKFDSSVFSNPFRYVLKVFLTRIQCR